MTFVAEKRLPSRDSRPPRRRWYISQEKRLLAWGSLVVFLIIWQLAVTLNLVNPFFFSSPTRIIETGIRTIPTARFWGDVRISATEFLTGYLAAVLVAVPVAILAGWYRWFGYAIEPWLNGINATPRIALLPLVVIWFGIGLPATIAIVFIGVFFTVAMNVFYGVNNVGRKYLTLAASYEASNMTILRTIVLPGTVPFIVAGARLGIGRGVIGVVIGEFYSSSEGLGNAIFRAGSTLKIDSVMFGALAITALAMLAYAAIARLERRFDAWRTDSTTGSEQ